MGTLLPVKIAFSYKQTACRCPMHHAYIHTNIYVHLFLTMQFCFYFNRVFLLGVAFRRFVSAAASSLLYLYIYTYDAFSFFFMLLLQLCVGSQRQLEALECRMRLRFKLKVLCVLSSFKYIQLSGSSIYYVM